MASDTKQEVPSGGKQHKPHSRLLSIFSCGHCDSKTEVSTTLPDDPDHHESAKRTHAGLIASFKAHLPKLHDHESISERGAFRIEIDEFGHGHAVENTDWPPGIVPYEKPNRYTKDQGLGPLAGRVIAPGGMGYGQVVSRKEFNALG
jgi:hypothetical protein